MLIRFSLEEVRQLTIDDSVMPLMHLKTICVDRAFLAHLYTERLIIYLSVNPFSALDFLISEYLYPGCNSMLYHRKSIKDPSVFQGCICQYV